MNNPYAQTKFLTSAARVSQLPEDVGCEVAFAGRSNAGKSSALNCLTGIKQLARTSKTPGRTQLMNVFTLQDDVTQRLIDLPGYGYAKVAKQVKADWQEHLAHYLEVRKSLRGLVLLMDVRHPLTKLDEQMMNWVIDNEVPTRIVLTKSDKLGRGAINQTVLKVKKHYELFSDLISVQAFSSLNKNGVDELIAVLNQWLCVA
jgi:GTP-binding protein